MFTVCLYMQILVLAPTYGAFGGQKYPAMDGEPVRACELRDIDPVEGICVLTEVADFIYGQNVMIPFLAVIFFMGTSIFYFSFMYFSFRSLKMLRRKDYVPLYHM